MSLFSIDASRRLFCRSLGLVLLASVAACTTSNFLPAAQSETKTAVPIGEQVGAGSVVIGLLATEEPNNLSGGASDSTYLAGRQAAQALAKAPVTLMIRRYDGKPASLKKLAADFVQAGAKVIIGPTSGIDTAALAKLVAGKGISVISTGRDADSAQRVFSAGLSISDEVAVSANEIVKRGYGGLIIATLPNETSQIYTSLLATAVVGAKIPVRLIDIADPVAGIAKYKEIMASDFKPAAIAFSVSPAHAEAFGKLLRADPAATKLPFIGNSGWSFAPPVSLGEGWYPTLAGNNLAAFGKKLAGGGPTLLGAVVYDLVTMAGALPQVVKDDPFQAAVITNEQGFKGQTGQFTFNASGVAERTFVVVPLK
jgi:hypothetical protein